MTLKQVKDQIDKIYEEVGDIDCFFRDEICIAYRGLYCHVGYNSHKEEIAILDLKRNE